jgi:hypothetical protein
MLDNKDIAMPLQLGPKGTTGVGIGVQGVARRDIDDGVRKFERRAGVREFVDENTTDTHVDDTGRHDGFGDPHMDIQVVYGCELMHTVIERDCHCASLVAPSRIQVTVCEARKSLERGKVSAAN